MQTTLFDHVNIDVANTNVPNGMAADPEAACAEYDAIIRSMGGEIEVHSKLGEGTEFLITLPLAAKDDPNKDTIFNDEE